MNAPTQAHVGGTGRIDVLDGWRAISVMLVVVSHYIADSSLKVHFSEKFRGICANYGQIGVQFFFVISGFVICSGMLREERLTDRISVSGFYIRRIARIIPPLAIYLLALAFLSHFGLLRLPISSLLLAATFTCNLPDTVTGGV